MYDNFTAETVVIIEVASTIVADTAVAALLLVSKCGVTTRPLHLGPSIVELTPLLLITVVCSWENAQDFSLGAAVYTLVWLRE